MYALLATVLFFCMGSQGQLYFNQSEAGKRQKIVQATSISDMNEEALILIQGHTEDGFIDEELKEKIIEALRAIRSEYPDMEKIQARPMFGMSSLDLELIEEAGKIIEKKVKIKAKQASNDRQQRHWRIFGISFEDETGIGEIDKLNKKYGVKSWSSNIGLRESGGHLSLNFSVPMDIATLKDIYESSPEVENAFLSGGCLDGDEIFFLPKGDSWHFVFKHGWGDCPSGCINNHYYYFTFNKQKGTVTKEGELPADKSRSGGIYLWGIPDRRAVRPFASYDDIKNKAKDSTWWISLHAIDVLGYLLTNPEWPRFGEDCSDSNASRHFENVRDDVLAHKQEAIFLLIQNLNHTDEQVSALAYKYLKEVTKEDFGNSKKAAIKWKKWLESRVN